MITSSLSSITTTTSLKTSFCKRRDTRLGLREKKCSKSVKKDKEVAVKEELLKMKLRMTQPRLKIKRSKNSRNKRDS